MDFPNQTQNLSNYYKDHLSPEEMSVVLFVSYDAVLFNMENVDSGFCCVLWHIKPFIGWLFGFYDTSNLRRLFDAKSMFIQIIISISNSSV